MRIKTRLIAMALLASLSVGAMAQDPTIHEVYQAAERGQLVEAQRMMAQVLKDHPGSAKAHFVDAELLARQGQIDRARVELAQAEKLQPGLPFAQPSAVSELRAKLSPPVQSSWTGVPMQSSTHPPGIPWGLIIGALALTGLALAWFRSRQPQATIYSNQPVVTDRSFGGYSGMPYPGGPVPATGGGLGSQMLGGLATGAAVGAGVVAGEALMHRVLGDGEHRDYIRERPYDEPRRYEAPPDASYDMGGQDFGLKEASSWDADAPTSDDGDGWN